MIDQIKAVYEGLIELSTREVMSALMIGLFLSLAISGLCLLGRRKVTDPLPLFCGLILLANTLSMAIGVGLSRYNQDHSANSSIGAWQVESYRTRTHAFGYQVLREADLDGNGRLTPEEAAQFVLKADLAGKGWADATDIDHVQQGWTGPQRAQDVHHETAPHPLHREGY